MHSRLRSSALESGKKRRGWRERVEPGVYKAHTVGCRSTADQKPGRRCTCPHNLIVPASERGATRTLTRHGLSLAEARNERRRHLAAGPIERPDEDRVPTLFEFAVEYFRWAEGRFAPGTVRERADHYRLRVHPALGHVPLTDLDRESLDRWLSSVIAGARSARMVIKTVEALRLILDLAMDWKKIPDNPARGLRLPRRVATREGVKALTPAQIQTLLRAGLRTLRAETLVRVLVECGLRRGEAIGLRWPDVDLAERRLKVRRSVTQERGRAALTGGLAVKSEKETKTGAMRTVPLSPALAARLALWFAESVVGTGQAADGYLWPGRDGSSPMGERTPDQVVERAMLRAGLVDHQGKPLVSTHGLRHTFGSILLSQGRPLPEVSRLLGHANTRVTAEIYAHALGTEYHQLAAEVFQDLFGSGHVAVSEAEG